MCMARRLCRVPVKTFFEIPIPRRFDGGLLISSLKLIRFSDWRIDISFDFIDTEIVMEPENYLYSSAKDYFAKGRGFLTIDFI